MQLKLNEVVKIMYYFILTVFCKLLGNKQHLSIWCLFFIVCIMGNYPLSFSLIISTIISGIFYICNFPVNKYLTYNLITGTVNMRLGDSKEFKGKTDNKKAIILTNGYLEGIKLLQNKKYVRKIKFTTHKLVVLQLKRNLKKWGRLDSLVKEEYIETSPLKERLFLYSFSEYKTINYKSILKKVEKYNIELKF